MHAPESSSPAAMAAAAAAAGAAAGAGVARAATPEPVAKVPLPRKAATDNKKAVIHYPFWFGGSASSMAACVTHPLDLGMSFSPCLVN